VSEHVVHLLLEPLHDILYSIPILFIVYLVIEYLERHLKAEQLLHYRDRAVGPLLGALLGSVPQCGFSAASATLYRSRVIGAGTLISVFIATSDEALPLLLANAVGAKEIAGLIACKILVAVLFGYLFSFTVFRKEKTAVPADPMELMDCDEHCHEHHRSSLLLDVLLHTLKTVAYIAVTLILIHLVIHFVGETAIEKLLLSNHFFQPLVTALVGLIPGCTTSVLLTELYVEGLISFGSVIAGLSTGAGFGFLILLRQHKEWKNTLCIVGCTYLAAVSAGLLLNLFTL